MSDEWTVGIVAQTVAGEVLLKMTAAQADELRDSLVWLTSDAEPARDDEDGDRG